MPNVNYTHEIYNKQTHQTRLAVISAEDFETTDLMDEDDRLYTFPKSEDGLYENDVWAVRKLRVYQHL